MEPLEQRGPGAAAVGRPPGCCWPPGRSRSGRCRHIAVGTGCRAAGAGGRPVPGRRRVRRRRRRSRCSTPWRCGRWALPDGVGTGAGPAGTGSARVAPTAVRPAGSAASTAGRRSTRRLRAADRQPPGPTRRRIDAGHRRDDADRRASTTRAARSVARLRVAALPAGAPGRTRRRPVGVARASCCDHVAAGPPGDGASAGPSRKWTRTHRRPRRPRAAAGDGHRAGGLCRLRGRRAAAPAAPHPGRGLAGRWLRGPRCGRLCWASSTGSTSPASTPCATSPRTTSSYGTPPSCWSADCSRTTPSPTPVAPARLARGPRARARGHLDAAQAGRRVQRVRLQRLPRDRLAGARLARGAGRRRRGPHTGRGTAGQGAADARGELVARSARCRARPLLRPHAALVPVRGNRADHVGALGNRRPQRRGAARHGAGDGPELPRSRRWCGRSPRSSRKTGPAARSTGAGTGSARPAVPPLRLGRCTSGGHPTPCSRASRTTDPPCPACRNTSGVQRWDRRCRCSPR